MWLGMMCTRSPTENRRGGLRSSMKPCSSFMRAKTDSGDSTTRPKLTSVPDEGRSDENVLEPPSTIIWPGLAVETTVARMEAAQSCHSHAPDKTVLLSLKMY